MSKLDSYRDRLASMRDRLRRQIEHEVEVARDSIHKPGEPNNLHTHNADMDVGGLDEAVGIGHALERRLADVEELMTRLDRDGEDVLKDKKERQRIDAFLASEDFATKIRKGK